MLLYTIHLMHNDVLLPYVTTANQNALRVFVVAFYYMFLSADVFIFLWILWFPRNFRIIYEKRSRRWRTFCRRRKKNDFFSISLPPTTTVVSGFWYKNTENHVNSKEFTEKWEPVQRREWGKVQPLGITVLKSYMFCFVSSSEYVIFMCFIKTPIDDSPISNS
jgi:hypothetical protein